LHVCFFSQEYPPETGWGGIGAYTWEMAYGLAAEGHRVTVISRAVERETIEEAGNVTVHRIFFSPNLDRMPILWRCNRYWPGFAWAALRRLRRIDAETRVDIVEAAENRADGFFLTWLWSRSPVVIRLHTAWIFVDRLNQVNPDRSRRFVYWLEKQSILRADQISAPCQAMVDLTRTWIPLKGRVVSVIPNPVNAAEFIPGEKAAETEILFCGRLERRKLNFLAEALPEMMRRCPGAHFRFVGADGPDENGESWKERLLRSVTEPDRERLSFDQAPRDRMPEVYRKASICLAPSVWENFPYVALEAMACGTPVVATHTGGFPEMIENDITGVLVSPQDPEALVDAVAALTESPARRMEMGENARRRIEDRYSVPAVTGQMLTFYRAAL
jgi:glycosyltransferase involved in cell wall biosynthesis